MLCSYNIDVIFYDIFYDVHMIYNVRFCDIFCDVHVVYIYVIFYDIFLWYSRVINEMF